MSTTWGTRVAAGAALALGLVGCGGGNTVDGAGAAEPATSTADPAAPDLDGTWSRVVTMRDAQALGVDPALASEHLGADGELPVDLELTADEWKVYVTSDEGERELGDFGTWSTADEDRWVFTSEAPGCRGCEIGYLVTSEGDRLTTEIDDDAPDGDVLLITEGTWTRRS